MKFKIGDTVELLEHGHVVDRVTIIDHYGTVLRDGKEVEFFRYSTDADYGTWYDENDTRLIHTKTNMNKLGSMFKKLTDKRTQTLYKAGFINGDLELTQVGLKELHVLLFNTKLDELVVVAQEKIDEEANSE